MFQNRPSKCLKSVDIICREDKESSHLNTNNRIVYAHDYFLENLNNLNCIAFSKKY